jgi:hypothetical protein
MVFFFRRIVELHSVNYSGTFYRTITIVCMIIVMSVGFIYIENQETDQDELF